MILYAFFRKCQQISKKNFCRNQTFFAHFSHILPLGRTGANGSGISAQGPPMRSPVAAKCFECAESRCEYAHAAAGRPQGSPLRDISPSADTQRSTTQRMLYVPCVQTCMIYRKPVILNGAQHSSSPAIVLPNFQLSTVNCQLKMPPPNGDGIFCSH